MLCTARWRGEPATRSDDGSAELSWRVRRQVEVDNPALPRVPEPIIQWTEIWRVRWLLHDHVPVHDGSQIFHGLFADVARCVVLLPNVVRPQVGGMGQNGGQVFAIMVTYPSLSSFTFGSTKTGGNTRSRVMIALTITPGAFCTVSFIASLSRATARRFFACFDQMRSFCEFALVALHSKSFSSLNTM